MSEQQESASAEEQAAGSEVTETTETSNDVKLSGIFAFKMGMSTVYSENGEAIPVTVLKYEPWIVSQVKTSDKDGYSALQIACRPKKKKNANKPEMGHFKAAGLDTGASIVREVRQELPEGAEVGKQISINSLAKGDKVSLCSRSKGRGFSGAMKRHGFGGGPASHGSGFHRRPGSVGNCEFPGRIMPGRKMPGQYGNKNITIRNLEIVDVLEDESVVLVRGSVPGARNSLVRITKQ